MATANRSRRSTARSTPRQLTVETHAIKKVFAVTLTTKQGEQMCWPEFFTYVTDAKNAAKHWREDSSGFSCIADAQVRRVASVTFAD